MTLPSSRSAATTAPPSARPQDEDPNALQARASDPAQSVWVGASAGSGKTKVLTDRLLRLLLPQGDNMAGTPVDKILCLTFTKAGAAEMAVRSAKTLARWAVTGEEALHAELSALLTRPPRPDEMESARRLFAQVIDSPGGLKILTIHSFCQSVLARFPLEAGLSPHLNTADETTARTLQKTALAAALAEAEEQATMPDGGVLARAIGALSHRKGEDDLMKLLEGLMGERARMEMLDRAYPAIDDFYAALCNHLGIDPGLSRTDMLRTALSVPALDENALTEIIQAKTAQRTSKRMQNHIPALQAMREAGPADRPALYESYRAAFLNKDGAKLGEGYLTVKAMPEHAIALTEAEADRILELEKTLKTLECAQATRDLMVVGRAVLRHYAAEKSRRGVLDYDDMIAYTLRLLSGSTMPGDPSAAAQWVMFKLDQGIDHILVDEAQDTNPEQWEIIHALCDDFFSGEGTKRGNAPATGRTIFAVGDEKQSIFSFQRAAPEEFRKAEQKYKQRAKQAGRIFDSVPMNTSFRSTKSVLAATDAIFAERAAQMLGLPDGETLKHYSFRRGQGGSVTLWPAVELAGRDDAAAWTPPTAIEDGASAEGVLCEQIAASIKSWIDRGEILPSHGRTVSAGDIMILVKSRNSIMERLVRALKTAGIPVSGVDRMQLNAQIPVQDLLAVAQFALLPEDDLTLGCVLKSPLIGMDEDDLAGLAIGRGGISLWQSLKNNAARYAAVVAWLEDRIREAGVLHPYEVFGSMLNLPCPADETGSGLRAMIRRLGTECIDPIEEFLNLALDYDTGNIPSLQAFLSWQAQGDTTIKREMESGEDCVRIMTVHASKGLQAPIVILPDTCHAEQSITQIKDAGRILWTGNGTDPSALPLWSPRAAEDCAAYKILLQAKKDSLRAEYCRLLYVAMTRAADRLYIGGCIRKRAPAEECWYNLIEGGFKRLEQSRDDDLRLDGNMEHDLADMIGLCLSNPQEAEPDQIRKNIRDATPVQPACEDWSWLHRAPPQEETPPRPWTPSRPDEAEPAMRSPLGDRNENGPDAYRFRRGNVTHALLQFLPGLPRDTWDEAAARFVEKQDLKPEIRADILRETMAVLNHPDFAPVFGPGSMPEVPMTALIGQKLVSGQIDRLLVTPEKILIVDYKTNRPPPTDPRDVPPLYRSQLRAYRDVLQKIYPGRQVLCALLWTDGPNLMAVDVD